MTCVQPMSPCEELRGIAVKLSAAAALGEDDAVAGPLRKLREASEQIGKSFCGSWLGYHSRIYYDGFAPPPPGASFSNEWGLQSRYTRGSRGTWREFDSDSVKDAVREKAGNPNLEPARSAQKQAARVFDKAKSDAISILETEIAGNFDPFLERLKTALEELEPMSVTAIVQKLAPKGPVITRDYLALGQGTKIPPHIEILAEVVSMHGVFEACNAASDICVKAASHLERKSRRCAATARIGTNVFIGHGRSPLWRELKDFIHDRLGLPWDEFNRVPVAGVTNITRLSEMLDAAAIAFLVMTAEDELADGEMQARMNVVHEAGLFQGRLGFNRAIVVLEEGCKEFSNIQGLGQIRFPKGNIAAVFEEVRQVLEREGLIGEVRKPI